MGGTVEYDADDYLVLMAAVVHRWWRDGLEDRQVLVDLAEWMDVDVKRLETGLPSRWYARLHQWKGSAGNGL